MTAPAIPEQYGIEVYNCVLRRMTYEQISEQLLERHGIQASASAVQSCLRRVKAQKEASLFDLTDGEPDVASGVAALDAIYRESRACTLRAAEGKDIGKAMRGLEQQLRVVRVYCEQVRRAVASKATPMAPPPHPDDTPMGNAEAQAFQGVVESHRGVAMTPMVPAAGAISTPAPTTPGPLPHLDTVIAEQRTLLAERRAREAADPEVQRHRDRWEGDHYRPPDLR